MTTLIRTATPTDWPKVSYLLEREFAGMTTELADARRSCQEPSTDAVLLVATDGGVIQGVAFAQRRWPAPQAWSYELLVVHPRSRGTGVGAALTAAVEAAAAGRGVEILVGVCNADVVEFHAHSGFTALSTGQPVLLRGDAGIPVSALTCGARQHFIVKPLAAVLDDPAALARTESVSLLAAGDLGQLLLADRAGRVSVLS